MKNYDRIYLFIMLWCIIGFIYDLIKSNSSSKRFNCWAERDAELNAEFMEAFDRGDIGACNRINREIKENYTLYKQGNL